MRFLLQAAFLAVLALAIAAEAWAQPLPVDSAAPAEFPGLHHVFRLSEKLYTGSVPERDEGFRSLRELGVRTIVSVDGMKPELGTARKYGLRYVHLPFGYDGCPVPSANAIAKAVRDLPGPVYIHCHHGLHRAPVAGAMARIALDGISSEQAIRELERAGTGRNYTGLYADVRDYRPPSKEELDRLPADFPESAPTPSLVATMVRIDARFSRLLDLQKAGWKPHTGIDAAGEALQLRELFAELGRGSQLAGRPVNLAHRMRQAERGAGALESALRAHRLEEASGALGLLAARCGSCHAAYRDVPQPR